MTIGKLNMAQKQHFVSYLAREGPRKVYALNIALSIHADLILIRKCVKNELSAKRNVIINDSSCISASFFSENIFKV